MTEQPIRNLTPRAVREGLSCLHYSEDIQPMVNLLNVAVDIEREAVTEYRDELIERIAGTTLKRDQAHEQGSSGQRAALDSLLGQLQTEKVAIDYVLEV